MATEWGPSGFVRTAPVPIRAIWCCCLPALFFIFLLQFTCSFLEVLRLACSFCIFFFAAVCLLFLEVLRLACSFCIFAAVCLLFLEMLRLACSFCIFIEWLWRVLPPRWVQQVDGVPSPTVPSWF
jgi:hypothetical protein